MRRSRTATPPQRCLVDGPLNSAAQARPSMHTQSARPDLPLRVRLDKNVPAGLVRDVFKQRPEQFALHVCAHAIGRNVPDDGICIRRARAQNERQQQAK